MLRVEDVTGELFRADRTRYCPVRPQTSDSTTSSSKTGLVASPDAAAQGCCSPFIVIFGTEDEEAALVEEGLHSGTTGHSVIRKYLASNVVVSL